MSLPASTDAHPNSGGSPTRQIQSLWDDDALPLPDSCKPSRYVPSNVRVWKDLKRQKQVNPAGPIYGYLPMFPLHPPSSVIKENMQRRKTVVLITRNEQVEEAVKAAELQKELTNCIKEWEQQALVLTNSGKREKNFRKQTADDNKDNTNKEQQYSGRPWLGKPETIVTRSVEMPGRGVRGLKLRIFSRPNRLVCPNCQHVTYRAKWLQSHMLRFHSHKCHRCCARFLSLKELTSHLKRCLITSHNCLLCDDTPFMTEALYRRHLKSKSHLHNVKIEQRTCATMYLVLTGKNLSTYKENDYPLVSTPRHVTLRPLRYKKTDKQNNTLVLQSHKHVYHQSPSLIAALKEAAEHVNTSKAERTSRTSSATVLPRRSNTVNGIKRTFTERATSPLNFNTVSGVTPGPKESQPGKPLLQPSETQTTADWENDLDILLKTLEKDGIIAKTSLSYDTEPCFQETEMLTVQQPQECWRFCNDASSGIQTPPPLTFEDCNPAVENVLAPTATVIAANFVLPKDAEASTEAADQTILEQQDYPQEAEEMDYFPFDYNLDYTVIRNHITVSQQSEEHNEMFYKMYLENLL